MGPVAAGPIIFKERFDKNRKECFGQRESGKWQVPTLMISYIKGIIASVNENFIILDNNGIGYKLTMPASSLYKLTEGMDVKIHTYMVVKEDDVSLFGFTTADELEMFKQLITVNGVGPKNAIGILSSISTEELILAIAAGDHKTIASSKGIGAKTAQKIVVELKDKINKKAVSVSASVPKASNDVETAVAFVSATGVSRAQCMKALSKAETVDGMDVDALIDLIFKNLSV